jgi:hypothetical protein
VAPDVVPTRSIVLHIHVHPRRSDVQRTSITSSCPDYIHPLLSHDLGDRVIHRNRRWRPSCEWHSYIQTLG